MLGHDAFYYNIIRKYIIAMGSLFNNIHVIRTDADAQVKDIKVPITFASKDKARNQLNSLHSRLKDQSKVGQILPRISYTLTGIEFDTTRLLNSRLNRSSHLNHETLTVSELPIGKPYNLTYQVSIWTKYIDDMFQIIEQSLAFFNPDYHITVKEIPELDVETNIPIIYRGCTPAFETEYDDNSWRVIRFDIDFEMKGWIYPPITNESIIENIKLNFYNNFDKDSQIALYQSEYDALESKIFQGLIEIDDPDFDTVIDAGSIKGFEQATLNVYQQETEPVLIDDEKAAYWFNTLSGQKFYIYRRDGDQTLVLIE